MRKDVVVA